MVGSAPAGPAAGMGRSTLHCRARCRQQQGLRSCGSAQGRPPPASTGPDKLSQQRAGGRRPCIVAPGARVLGGALAEQAGDFLGHAGLLSHVQDAAHGCGRPACLGPAARAGPGCPGTVCCAALWPLSPDRPCTSQRALRRQHQADGWRGNYCCQQLAVRLAASSQRASQSAGWRQL